MAEETTLSATNHDATPTWSGFAYQGKVAIYVVLDYISRGEIDDYELELEWEEDFSILKNDNRISFHQVKAYKPDDSVPSKYKTAIKDIGSGGNEKGLISRIRNNPDAIGYLHVASQIRFYSQPANFQEIVRGADDNQSPSLYNNIKLYPYPDYSNREYCEIDKIKTFILSKIASILQIQNTSDKKVEVAYCRLLAEIDEHVVQRHKDIQDGNSRNIPTISFDLIKNIIQEDPIEEYLKYLFKEAFIDIYEEYLDMHPNRKLKEYLDDVICPMPIDNLIAFYKSISPHKYGGDDANLVGLLDTGGMHNSFLKIVLEIQNQFINERINNSPIIYYRNAQRCYLPSTICDSNDREFKAHNASKILKNSGNSDVLFRMDNIITERLDSDGKGLAEIAKNVVKIEEDDKDYEKIMHIKKICFIPLPKAKQIIDGGTL